jgi:hypothetical protein
MPPELDHAELKRWIPPRSSIWRGLKRMEFCGHMPPRRRIQARWSDFASQSECAKDIIRRLLARDFEIEGIPWPTCLVAGML